MTNDTLPGYYRGYLIEEGELPDGEPATFISRDGAVVDWACGSQIPQAHAIVDEWMNAR